MTIKITFLGTSDQIPSAKRNHSAILLNYNGENILVDCGEGTQRQFRRARLNPCKITRILITHWHGDHVLGLPGILQTLALAGYNKTLYIYGPKKTKRFVEEMLKLFNFQREYKIEVEEVGAARHTPKRGILGQRFFENKDFYLEAEEMNHGIPCNAYNFVKKGQIRIDKLKLKKSGLPEGPLLSQIKQGKDVVYNGKKYKAKDLTFKEEDIKVSFVLDTKENKKIIPFVKKANLLISEASFGRELEKHAKEHYHLISEQIGKIAKKADVKKLIATHLSQRYENKFKEILAEIKKNFKEVSLAKDLESVEVK